MTKLSIENVALSCGYQNALVFSKAFKREVGCVPTVYRARHCKAIQKNLVENQELLERLEGDSEDEKWQNDVKEK